jgi:predicted PurR-regulated permease PerM
MQNKETNQSKQIESYIGWAVLLILLVGTFRVLKPFLSAGIWAAILAFSLWPANNRLTIWLRGRRTLAALITTVGISLMLLAPFVVLGFNLADDIQAVSTAAQKWGANGSAAPAWLEKIPLIGPHAKAYWTDMIDESAKLTRQLNQATENVSTATPSSQTPAPEESKLVGMLGKVINEARSLLLTAVIVVGEGIVQVALSLLLMFFLLCDVSLGDRFTGAVVRIAGERGRHLLKVAGDTVRGVIYGILGTAIVQGAVAAAGFAIAGVPGPVFLGLLVFFLSPVPVGPPLVWVPASIWLFAHDQTGWGIFMLIWGLGVSTIDNIVKPWLISQGSHMPFLLIFFGVIGGALSFGFIGIFIGPSLLAVTYCLVDEWLENKM